MQAPGEHACAEEAAQFVLSRTVLRPRIAVLLGSGFGGVAEELRDAAVWNFTDIPHFAPATAIGHAGKFNVGSLEGLPLVVMQGRLHRYEGYSAAQVAFPVRMLARMGISAMVTTNAAGGINSDYRTGELAVIRDHINLQGDNPLVGVCDPRLGLRHPDMTNAYSPRFRQLAVEQLRRMGETAREGVYAALLGPSFETPAEISLLRRLGADLVGMSTVPEVIVARQEGIEVLAISCVTNMAAVIGGEIITAGEVFEVGRKAQLKFVELLRDALPKMAQALAWGS